MTVHALQTETLEMRAGTAVLRVRFDDGSGGTGSALAVLPPASVARPVGIVVAHGGFEPGAHIFLDEAIGLTARGATVVLPEITFPRSDDLAEHELAISRAIGLQRRAVDLLEHYGAARFGFYGHSAGGAQGAILSTVEPRLRAIVIAGAGAGLVSRLRRPLVPPAPLARLARFDPERWVHEDNGRALFIQHGLLDDVVPVEDGRLLYEAVAGRKQWAEYDCGHGVDDHAPARADRLEFFARELGL